MNDLTVRDIDLRLVCFGAAETQSRDLALARVGLKDQLQARESRKKKLNSYQIVVLVGGETE